MKKLNILIYMSLSLMGASLLWASIFAILPALFYGEAPSGFETQLLGPAFVMAFVISWAPALLTYAKVDLAKSPPTGLKRLSYFALSGMITAMALPLLGVILTLIVNIIDPGYAPLDQLGDMVLFALWLGIPGFFAGALFGALMKQIAPPPTP